MSDKPSSLEAERDLATRRTFLRTLAEGGGALLIGVALLDCRGQRPDAAESRAFNAWVRISEDGRVTVTIDRAEMGQGVTTALAQLVVEELECRWEDVHVSFAPADDAIYRNPLNGAQNTGGSTSVAAAWEPLRRAGAQARTALVTAASRRWQVPEAECEAVQGTVHHHRSGRRATFGELVLDVQSSDVPAEVTLKSPSEFRVVGQPIARLDVRDKVTGRAVFGIDAGPPHALTALVARAPVPGAVLQAYNRDAALAVEGVAQVVEVGTGVAVVARGYWPASRGRDALGARWDGGDRTLDSDGIRRTMLAALDRPTRKGVSSKQRLMAESATLEVTYEVPYLAHACMEPMSATAWVHDGSCEVWTGTQYQSGQPLGGGAREVAAEVAGLDPSRVTIHSTYLGGGFGRRAMQDAVREAVEVARRVGQPVRLIYSREDDIRHDYFRPPLIARFRVRLDGDDVPSWVHGRVACPSILARMGIIDDDQVDPITLQGIRDSPYVLGDLEVDVAQPRFPHQLGFWRSVGHSQTGFVMETLVDEMAVMAGRDPVQYRRQLLAGKARHLRVLDAVAQASGWTDNRSRGVGRGVAIVESYGSVCAQVVEVVPHETRGIRVRRVWCAIDCGRVVNPGIVRAQLEGGVLFGLGAALFGQVTIKGGAVVESNFHDYRVLRASEAPHVETILVPSESDPTGVGELAVPPIAAAVGNAIRDLSGQRLRRLPFSVALG